MHAQVFANSASTRSRIGFDLRNRVGPLSCDNPEYPTWYDGGAETAYCDLCLDCGHIVRLYVMTTDRDWYTGTGNQE